MSTDRDIWAVLGLNPPSGGDRYDERTVKRAYAKALKSNDPAGDPAGFQAIRQAYERGLELARVPGATVNWKQFATDIGASLSEIIQINNLIRDNAAAIQPDSQIALDALCDMELVAALDLSSEGHDVCVVLNALLEKSGSSALQAQLLTQIADESEAIWDNPINEIETAVEYVAARFSRIVSKQNKILLTVFDESEDSMFAIADKAIGSEWVGEKIGDHIRVFGVDANLRSNRGDLFHEENTSRIDDNRIVYNEARYAVYARMLDAAMALDSGETEWINLLGSLDECAPQLRDDVEMQVFGALHNYSQAADDNLRLPSSLTAGVVEALNEQFRWLSDTVRFERKFGRDSDVMVLALNKARGQTASVQRIPQKLNWLLISALVVLMYAIVRNLIEWLLVIGLIT